MDYSTARLAFKVRKALRYVRLFGPQRTLAKIRGQYHVKRQFPTVPPRSHPVSDRAHFALIGCGNYAFATIAYYLRKLHGDVIRGVMDSNLHAAASLRDAYRAGLCTDDVSDLLRDEKIDLVFIASNHASHAEYAIQCLDAGKSVHIEKPHVVSAEQLERLSSAMQRNPGGRVFLGFNRPRSPLFRDLQRQLARQSGPLMINWFVAGHEIPDGHWYFNEAEGGRVLGNLCHWTDLTLHLVGLAAAFPCRIVPATPEGSRSDFLVSVSFADGSCAAITFSAKGHTFEGVREVLNVHKGDVLANLTDFGALTIEVGAERTRRRLLFRDHGHAANIAHSSTARVGEDPAYVHLTAAFFLAIKTAIDSGVPVSLSRAEALGPWAGETGSRVDRSTSGDVH